MFILSASFLFLRSLLQSRISLVTEILALRQQLAVLNRTVKRPKLHRRDRLFRAILSRLWKDWREVLIIVQPDTVIKWHREGLQSLLALEIKSADRTASARLAASRVDPHNLTRESTVGNAPHPIGTSPPRFRSCAANRRQISD